MFVKETQIEKKDDLCSFNNDEVENNYNGIYPDELELKKENENLLLSFLIKEMPFHFILIGCPTWAAIYHLKCFMLRLLEKLHVLPRQQQI